MNALGRLWAVCSPLAIGGIVGFAVTSIDGCTARSDESEPFIDCDGCPEPAAATYVLESRYADAQEDDFPQLGGALFTVNDYDWREPYDPDSPNAVLRYLDGEIEVTVVFSYENPSATVDPDAPVGGAAGNGGFGGGR